MAKRQEEEFNPWPSFVDIFSSVILVLLLFLLITIVNLGYYAQFKFKVSYTGSITSDEIILDSTISENVVDQDLKQKKREDKNVVKELTDEELKQDEQIKDSINNQNEVNVYQYASINNSNIRPDDNETVGEGEFASPGGEIINNKSSKQDTIKADNHYIISFSDETIFLDDPIIKDIEKFVKVAHQKNPNHYVLITAVDPKKQISATIAKQISLARTLSARNLLRKFRYDRNDVKINLLKDVEVKEEVNEDYGYIIIEIKNK